MDLNEYQLLAARTCPDLGEKLNIAHMMMGMFSEINELTEAHSNFDSVNIGEELADIEWYLANYCRMWNYEYAAISSSSFDYPVPEDHNKMYLFSKHLSFLIDNLSKLTDLSKRFIIYNKLQPAYNTIGLMSDIHRELRALYATCDLNADQCRINNINKLKVRYPDKFSEEKALNRDLDAERTELEK